MRLPTSTIVMALVTCVPFGLAIRDTLAGPHPADDAPVQEIDNAQAELERASAQREAEETQRLANRVAGAAEAVKQIYGPELATPGSLFDGIVIGISSGNFQPEAARARIQKFQSDHAVKVSFEFDSAALNGIVITPEDDETCEALEHAVVTAWGSGIDLDTVNGLAWLNPATNVRAVLERTDCRLTFDRFATVATWINKTPTSVVPLWALGQPADKLTATLTGEAHVDDELISWTALPLAAGRHGTHLSATVNRGKVVGLTAQAETDRASSEAVEQMLVTTYGTPKVDAEDKLHWSKPPMMLDTTSDPGSVLLTIGHP